MVPWVAPPLGLRIGSTLCAEISPFATKQNIREVFGGNEPIPPSLVFGFGVEGGANLSESTETTQPLAPKPLHSSTTDRPADARPSTASAKLLRRCASEAFTS